MEISLLALAPLLFAARAFLALRAEQELHAPGIDADPVVCSQLGANYSYLSRAQFMLERCPATVSTTCTAQQAALRDGHHDPAECKRWAVSRQCASNPSFMTEQCNASCGELLLQQHAARLRMQLLAVRLAVPAAWQRDDAAANCSSVDAAACLEDAERMMRLCPASCLGLGIPDNSSSHSCQLWAQRDECVKNAGFMKDACASTCSEHLFREQTKLRLARNTLGGAKHALDALAAAGLLLVAALLRTLLRTLRRRPPSWLPSRLHLGQQRDAWRAPQPAVGVPALPCALVASYFACEALCSLQSRLAYWDWLNPDWRQGKTALKGVDLKEAWSVLVLPATCAAWLWRRQSAPLAATCVAILAAHLVADTVVNASHHHVQGLALAAMEREGGDGSAGVVYTRTQLRQKREQLVAEGGLVVERISLLGCLVAFLAAHAAHIRHALDLLPEHSGTPAPPPPQAVAIGVGRILIGVPFVIAAAAELRELLVSDQLAFPCDDARNVLWPKAAMLALCTPLTLGLGPFQGLARALAVLCVLEAVLLWCAPAETMVMWLEADQRGTLSYKEAFASVLHHRRHFGLLLALSGGFSLLGHVGAGGYTLGGLLKKRA